MKVKIFSSQSVSDLEAQINLFLESFSKIIDIKYSTSDQWSEALVIYDESEAQK